ncbi:hypothetical protein KR054_009015 [Drosophila jambulina]|nr:hypothetical protein KR054_009015 [Drosophila jambulina]
MWILYAAIVTCLLASSGGQYQRHRPKRMHSYDLVNGGDGGDIGYGRDADDGDLDRNGNGNGNCNGNEGNTGCGRSSSSSSSSSSSNCGERSHKFGQKMQDNCENAKQRSSGIAIQAAKEAKKANDDMAPAVKAAADKIKTEYADKATAAANAADAVLFGKGQMLEQLEAEVCNARAMLEPEVQKLAAYEENDQLANKALNQSKRQLKGLINLLKSAKDKLCSIEMLMQVWDKSVQDGFAVMDAAQKRVNMLMPIHQEVLYDREKTKKAAEIAARAAEEAKSRVDQMEKTDSCQDNQDRERQRRAWPYNMQDS